MAGLMTEDQLQMSVVQLAGLCGWEWFHDEDSRRNRAGLPDLILVRGHRLLWRELKTTTGRVRPDQKRWIALLQAAGEDAGVWRPAQWFDGTIRKELR
jgi:hypothetical protein